MEEKATQRGELADTTWSVGKKGTKLRPKLLPGVDFPVKVFHWHQSEGDDPTTKASTAPSQPPPKGKSPLLASPPKGEGNRGDALPCVLRRYLLWLLGSVDFYISKEYMEYMEIPHP